MGQDSSCGICGKHHQQCKHHIKQHVPDGNRALCGQRNGLLLEPNWLDCDIDPEDVCEKCKKMQHNLGRDLPLDWDYEPAPTTEKGNGG